MSVDDARSEIVVALDADVLKWDCVTNVCTKMSLSSDEFAIFEITSIAWSPDSRYVAVGTELAELKVSWLRPWLHVKQNICKTFAKCFSVLFYT